MELGNKIKALRLKAGITQGMLAEELGVSFQTVSKWENGVCAPDIMMLPKLSVYFGVTIDELFDLTVAQKLHRIENMLDMEQELPHSTFVETVDFLKEQLEGECEKGRIYSFLAHVYHHRMVSDSDKVSEYIRRSLMNRPEQKDGQWLLNKAEGSAVCDWNKRNRHKTIRFYKELIAKWPQAHRNYLELMDNLLADNRTNEAAEYLEAYKKVEGHMEMQIPVYEGRIALAQHNTDLAAEKFKELEERFPTDGHAMFELANYHAEQCHYEEAIMYFEKSFALDKRPRYVDALEGMATIYEIQGKYEEAINCCDRMLQTLEEEFAFTEGEPVRVVLVEKQRLQELLAKEK